MISLAQRLRHLLPAPAVAQRDRDGALGGLLPDDVLVELGDDLLRGHAGRHGEARDRRKENGRLDARRPSHCTPTCSSRPVTRRPSSGRWLARARQSGIVTVFPENVIWSAAGRAWPDRRHVRRRDRRRGARRAAARHRAHHLRRRQRRAGRQVRVHEVHRLDEVVVQRHEARVVARQRRVVDERVEVLRVGDLDVGELARGALDDACSVRSTAAT